MSEVQKIKKHRPKPRVGLWRWVWRLTAGTFAVLVVLLALAIGLFRVALPLLPDYQERIEAAATQAIGFPLEVNSIDARMRLAGPELVFEKVKFLSKDSSSTLLEVDRAHVVVNFWTLISRGKIEPASVSLSGFTLNIVRGKNGRFYVQNLLLPDSGPAKQSESERHAWGLPNGHFRLRNIGLSYLDNTNQSAVVKIHDIDLDLDVADNLLNLEGDLQLTATTTQRLDFSFEADGRIDQIDAIEWQTYLHADGVDFKGVHALLPNAVELSSSGVSSFTLWAGAQGGRIKEATLDADLSSLAFAAQGADISVAFFDRIAGHFTWEKDQQHWQVQGSDVVLARDGHTWPSGNVLISERNDKDIDNEQYVFSIDYLNLGDLLLFAPLAGDNEIISTLKRYSPSGAITGVDGFVQLRGDGVHNYGLTAKFDNLSVAAVDEKPGFEGISGDLFGGHDRGGININSTDAMLHIPAVLRNPVAAKELTLSSRWIRTDTQFLQLDVEDLSLLADDIIVSGSMSFDKVLESDPLNGDITLSVNDLVLEHAHRYFPKNRFSDNLLKWLDAAFTQGAGHNGNFLLKGPLNKFPFKDKSDGEFRAEIDLIDATLNYSDKWPAATDLNGHLVFHRDTFSALIDSARVMSLKLQDGQVGLPDFAKAVIDITGRTEADLGEIQEFLNASPLVDKLGRSWPDFGMRGASAANLQLKLPTKNLDQTKYSVNLQFQDSEVAYRNWPQTVSQLQGQLKIDNKQFVSESLRGSFMGRPVEIQVKPDAVEKQSGRTEIVFKGTTRGELLATHVLEPLGDVLKGEAAWTAQTFLQPKQPVDQPFSVRVQSPLEAMAVVLPQPLDKPVGQVRFFDASIKVLDETRIETIIEYGGDTNIHANFQRASSDADTARWKVERGEIRFGGGAAQIPSKSVVRAVGNVPRLDVSEILEFTERNSSDDPWVELSEAELAITEMLGFDQNFAATDLTLNRDTKNWNISLVSEQATGSLVVPVEITPESPITGAFELLKWTSDDAENQKEIDPASIPSMVFTIEQFFYDQYQLGAANVRVEARDNFVALREFKTTAPGFETRSTGSWSFGKAESNTYVQSELISTDVRATLKSLNLAEFMDASSASAKLEMTWPDGWTPDYLQTVQGTLSLSVGSGQLHSVDPGAGRVFGLMSIGALPRRLGLDFTDVFGSGFGFDSIVGDFALADGNAHTDNLVLIGPAANVGIVGRTGLVAKDYDQTALVYANFGSSLPLAGAIAGGPAIGAALLVFSEIFKSPLRQMGRVSYHISGSWDDPVIAKTGAERAQEPAESPTGESNPLAQDEAAGPQPEAAGPQPEVP